ncbi:MAG: PQQ-binding-like beta-propeller repeat protein, partial [Planctomycetota bacterium]
MLMATMHCGATTLRATGKAEAQAHAIIESTGFRDGLIVEIDCDGGELTAALGNATNSMVQGLDTDYGQVQQTRQAVRKRGLGGRVSARFFDGRKLPYADNLVNLVLVKAETTVPKKEIMRVLTPLGTAWLDGEKMTKPWPDDIDEWSHYLHGADNNAVAADKKVNLPRSIQWKAGPEWDRSHAEMSSMSAAVTAKGRIFYIIDDAPLMTIRFPPQWKLVARDAFNGKFLWEKPLANWVDTLRVFRSGPVHLQRRLTAKGDRVYATLGLDAPVSVFDAATGKKLQTYEGTEYTEEISVANGLLYLVVGTSETNRHGDPKHGQGHRGLREEREPEPSDFRYITAIDPQTGNTVWKRDYSGKEMLMPVTMAIKGKYVAYKTTEGVVCLDSRSGKKLWQTEEPTPDRRMAWSAPTVVATEDVLLCVDRVVDEKAKAADGSIEWGVGSASVRNVPRSAKTLLRAYDIDNGEFLWDAPCKENYNAPADVFVVGDTVYASTGYEGYDLRTGKQKTKINKKRPPVSMPHARCYRDKATERFIFEAATGVELFDFEDGWVGNNSWVRGACQYGILPANGFLYAPPDPCACYAAVKVSGFFAASPQRKSTPNMELPAIPVRVEGPAYGTIKADNTDENGWPMYRQNPQRDGAIDMDLPDRAETRWREKLASTKLTQPVVVDSCLIVGGVDNHTVYALDADSGEKRWNFVAGGRIDSAPTIYKGQVIFGSADGWVYSLDMGSGQLVWRFRAAPNAMQVGVESQLESAWPVHGSVLVHNDTL